MQTTTTTLSPMEALNAVCDKVWKRFRPAGNVHKSEVDEGYLSVSKLTQKRAGEYARILFDRKADDVDPYWAFKGNTLASEALRDFMAHEVQVRIPIPGTAYFIVGHMDGIDVIGIGDSGVYVVGEHKAYGEPTDRKVEVAKRQALLYLAGVYHTLNQVPPGMAATFLKADYAGGGEFKMSPVWSPAGVVVAVAPNMPPATVLPFAAGREDCEEVLKFYQSKAAAIIKALETGDMSHADAWDSAHSDEFVREFEDVGTTLPELEDLAKRYSEAAAQEKAAKAIKEEVTPLISLALQQAGITKGETASFKVSMVNVAGRDVPARWQDGYSYPKVTAKREA